MDIFEQYGIQAKHYDALCNIACHRSLNGEEKDFVNAFSATLDGEMTEQEMKKYWNVWMDSRSHHL